ncbi:MAG TPA: hypothetical protein ENH82_03920 [bacterium]|nr:hypothetical protein [bacterium]
MKSTKRILQITDKYGVDDKQSLYRELRALRRDVKAELLYHVRAGIQIAERAYYDEIKPGHSIKQKYKPGEHPPQTGINLP